MDVSHTELFCLGGDTENRIIESPSTLSLVLDFFFFDVDFLV